MADNRRKCCCGNTCSASCHILVTFDGVTECSCVVNGTGSDIATNIPNGTYDLDNYGEGYYTGWENYGWVNYYSFGNCTGNVTESPAGIAISAGFNSYTPNLLEIFATYQNGEVAFYGNATITDGNLGNLTISNACSCGAYTGGGLNLAQGGTAYISAMDLTCWLPGINGNCSSCPGNYTIAFTPIGGGSTITVVVTNVGGGWCVWSDGNGTTLEAERVATGCYQWSLYSSRLDYGVLQWFATCGSYPCPPNFTGNDTSWSVTISGADSLIEKFKNLPKQNIDPNYVPTAANATKGRCCS